jgi:hypothetical protein
MEMLWEIIGIAFLAIQAVMLLISVIGLTLALLGFSEEKMQQILYRLIR